ncbi:MAG: homocysteine S-methyltransferase family protein [Defluviitaleaceae bacterium]|nr:homocysteine S-methyltransferase family protein [Defluviitaleaceae bacterium]
MNIRERLGKEIIIFDGAMGTMLQARGFGPGILPEVINLESPGVITDIHAAYVKAGAMVVTANTFGAGALKLRPAGQTPDKVVTAGIECAKKSGAQYVALDIGPLGQLMEPFGAIRFEEAYELFREQVVAGALAGADLILIETMSSLYEVKAALLAAKENSDLPVFCTMSFEADGRSFMGCDGVAAAVTLSGLGVDALGANCSLGPAALRPVVDELLRYGRVPVMVQPNAGIPEMRGGTAVYITTPAEFAVEMFDMVRAGVSIVGGCCGTTPEFVAAMKSALDGTLPQERHVQPYTACTCETGTVFFDRRTTVIGERLNPTGKRRLQEALRSGDMNYLLGEAVAQAEAGSDVLDLNVGLPELDEPVVLTRATKEVQAICQIPLQLDSADPAAIEAAARVYNGKPIINSVNGKQAVMDAIFPIAKKYGALVVCLTLDENGIPATAQARVEVLNKIVAEAAKYGIEPNDLLVDCLTLTASAQQDQVAETLRAIEIVRGMGMHTVLGVSNVSFGLPQREILNAAFLAAAFGAGLSAAIINPLSEKYRETVDAFRVITGEDRSAARYTERYAGQSAVTSKAVDADASLDDLIRQGRRDETAVKVRALLENMSGLDVIDSYIIPALSKVGERFEKGEIFLPQLMQAAQAAQSGFTVIRDRIVCSDQTGGGPKGKILLATVHGDIHDIGKNIVRLLLENYGYDVVDLGKDVPPSEIVKAVGEHGIRLVGLSALMTTTVGSMTDTIAATRTAGHDCSFIVGGAVMSERYRELVGADYYAKDAMEGIALAKRFFGTP